MGIVRFALKFPYTFYVLAAFILFLGISAITVMPEDIFPEINIPVVTVIWQYTGLSVPEMEQRVTTYSQYSISTSVSGIKNMEAQTLNGISVQKIYFQPDVNLDLAIAQIVSATNTVRTVMPPASRRQSWCRTMPRAFRCCSSASSPTVTASSSSMITGSTTCASS